jgi:hypothetical protein
LQPYIKQKVFVSVIKIEYEPKTFTPDLSESIAQSKLKRFFNSIEKKKTAYNSVVVELK